MFYYKQLTMKLKCINLLHLNISMVELAIVSESFGMK